MCDRGRARFRLDYAVRVIYLLRLQVSKMYSER